MQRPALVSRLPKLRWHRRDTEPFVPMGERAGYPDLAPDLALLDDVLVPVFRERDADALHAQNAFWRQQLLLILGGTAATILGITQSALGGGVAELGAAEAVLSGLLTWLAVTVRNGRWHRRYLTRRLQAERLRSEYFVFLARAGTYRGADAASRLATLRAAIEDLDADEQA